MLFCNPSTTILFLGSNCLPGDLTIPLNFPLLKLDSLGAFLVGVVGAEPLVGVGAEPLLELLLDPPFAVTIARPSTALKDAAIRAVTSMI
jgi:hypothetical protein